MMEFLDYHGDKPFFGSDRKLMGPKDPPKPGEFGYRLIPGRVWWLAVHWPWRLYIASKLYAIIDNVPPLLAPYGKPTYFTDAESLSGFSTASDFAERLGLHDYAKLECYSFGCVIIKFRLTDDMQIATPLLTGVAPSGLTIGGAREWIVDGPVPINSLMTVHGFDLGEDNYREYRVHI